MNRMHPKHRVQIFRRVLCLLLSVLLIGNSAVYANESDSTNGQSSSVAESGQVSQEGVSGTEELSAAGTDGEEESPAADMDEEEESPAAETEGEEESPAAETEGEEESSAAETDGEEESSAAETEGEEESSAAETEEEESSAAATDGEESSAAETDPVVETEPTETGPEEEGGNPAEESPEQIPETEIKPPLPPEGIVVLPFSDVTTVDDYTALKDAIDAAVPEILLGSDIVLDASLAIPAGAVITISGDYILSAGSSFNDGDRHFYVDGDLTLTDGVCLDGGNAAGGVEIKNTGSFVMDHAEIINCRAEYGGGIEITDGGYISMIAGTISNCSADKMGGGIYIDSDSGMTLSAGTIENCSAHFGAGIYMTSNNRAEFQLTGNLLIQGCETAASDTISSWGAPRGGGLEIGSSDLIISGDVRIIDCKAWSGDNGGEVGAGGGISAASGSKVEIRSSSADPVIAGCEAAGNGGGIWADGDVYFYSGTIDNCMSAVNGGGVFLLGFDNRSNTFYMEGGIISNCRSETGGGFFVSETGNELAMNSGQISHCQASANGGGIAVIGGSLSMGADALIENCHAGIDNGWWAGKGGGIYLNDNGSAAISESTIRGCTTYVYTGQGEDGKPERTGSFGSGAGIFLELGCKVTIADACITDCVAACHGGGIFAKNYEDLTVSNVYFEANEAAILCIPGDNIVTDPLVYPCLDAANVSPGSDELWGREYPLNNYDINYLSFWFIYAGNGGTDEEQESDWEYQTVTELTPFAGSDEVSDYTYTVLTNEKESNGGVFEFVKSGSYFGMWSNHHEYVPGSANEYWPLMCDPGDLTITAQELVNNGGIKFYVLWMKDVYITPQVIGAYGDRTKEFTIDISVLDAYWNPIADLAGTYTLSHGQSTPAIPMYEGCFLTVGQRPDHTAGYTVAYNDRYNNSGNPMAEYPNILISGEWTDDWIVTVENTWTDVVPAGIAPDNKSFYLMGLLSGGLILLCSTMLHRRKRYCRRKEV